MRILVVDNDRSGRQAVADWLRGQGHEVVCASGGMEGWKLLQGDPTFSLLIAGCVLAEDVDGPGLLARARELKRPRPLPTILLVSPAEKGLLASGGIAGVDLFLARPLNEQELDVQLRLVERLLSLEDKVALLTRNLEEAQARIVELASTDELTQISNRQFILHQVEREVARATRYRTLFSVLLLDIDHFKSLNDTHGLPAGDGILRKAASLLAQSIRETDCIGRRGGAEFLVLLPGSGSQEAQKTAERLRKTIESTAFSLGPDVVVNLTVSLGVAEFHPGTDSARSLLNRVDRALWRAKDTGRNRVRTEAPLGD